MNRPITEMEFELMETVITRAREVSEKPASTEAKRKLDWGLRALDSFRDSKSASPVVAQRLVDRRNL
jgi:hypothetical protein